MKFKFRRTCHFWNDLNVLQDHSFASSSRTFLIEGEYELSGMDKQTKTVCAGLFLTRVMHGFTYSEVRDGESQVASQFRLISFECNLEMQINASSFPYDSMSRKSNNLIVPWRSQECLVLSGHSVKKSDGPNQINSPIQLTPIANAAEINSTRTVAIPRWSCCLFVHCMHCTIRNN